jgi:hypothetical protein
MTSDASETVSSVVYDNCTRSPGRSGFQRAPPEGDQSTRDGAQAQCWCVSRPDCLPVLRKVIFLTHLVITSEQNECDAPPQKGYIDINRFSASR